MTVSKKQLKANRQNAKKGGVKTEEGKAIVKYNAIKHGILAKEVVITVGEGAESQEEFDTLSNSLNDYFNPVGTLEQMLVEKIIVSQWRLRRAYRYEAGLIRCELDNATDMYYDQKGDYYDEELHRTDDKIDTEITEQEEQIESWQDDKKNFTRMKNKGKDLEDTYELDRIWEWLDYTYNKQFIEGSDVKPDIIHQHFKNADWSDNEIWQALIDVCDDQITNHTEKIKDLQKEKQKNALAIQRIKKLGQIPDKIELDKLLKYEGSIEKQFYKAMNQLERVQRYRLGDNVPAPIKIDVDLNNPTDS